jgi:single-strand DNA-binding protein
MSFFNSVRLMGRITYQPELRKTSNDISVVNFQIAAPRPYQKDKEATSDFIDCQAWRNNADFIEKYFNKGDMICLEGTIQTNSYTDKEGNKRKSVLVVAEDIQFAPINKGKNNNNGAGNDNTTNQPAPKYASADNTDFEEIVDDDDDDLPF